MSKASSRRGHSRRKMLAMLGLGGAAGVLALAGAYRPVRKWWRLDCQDMPVRQGLGYGPLRRDPRGMLDLPAGFSYRVLCRKGELMDDGFRVPGSADGAAVFSMPGGGYRIIRNHEVSASQVARGRYEEDRAPPVRNLYDTACRGGTITLVLDDDLRLNRKFLSLTGTDRNCSGGRTPWESWLSCEESAGTPATAGYYTRRHGYVFEVFAAADGLTVPQPLKAMGRFVHEAVALNPAGNEVYQTEDQGDGCFYKFIPRRPGDLSNGRLFALRIKGRPGAVTANQGAEPAQRIPVGRPLPADWVELQKPDPERDTLRLTARSLGAATFARGEGATWASGGTAFAATSGGPQGLGQIWHYRSTGGEEGELTLLAEAKDECEFNMPDNMATFPTGDIVLAEDNNRYTRLIGLTPAGEAYPFAYYQHATKEEMAGIAFAPGGRFMVVNAYQIGLTFLVTGPFAGNA